ncbi:calcium sensing receptor, chloroplastic isoform X2 [Carica papaya]|uniref:calcium sensing receptor, chloroplastic isoform X2 n=1 Tax=Carica papaya TaxID=3649 RepID=UPI000B8CFCB1|nr:calcium sensing receptor, chloroplastic isoform X2 [Carica papaya]
MTMLPVCSATACRSSHSQICFHSGLRPIAPFPRDLDSRCNVEGRAIFNLSKGTHLHRISSKVQAAKYFHSSFVEINEESVSMDLIKTHSCQNELDNIKCSMSDTWSSTVNEPHLLGSNELKYVGTSDLLPVEEGLSDLQEQLAENAKDLIGNAEPEPLLTVDIAPNNLSDALDLNNSVKNSFEEFIAGVKESFGSSFNKGENAVKSSVDTITSSITAITKNASEAVDNAVSKVFPTVDQTGEFAGNKITSFSFDLKQTSGEATVVAVNLLRRAIVAVEDSIANGASFLVYSYGSAKELLPPEIRDALNLSEEKAVNILRPIGTAFQQVYITIEELERNLGLNPDDPILPFVLFLGTSATFWVFYWLWAYGGYSGDLSPKSTLELLTGKENALLIDVRPEVLRERDGVPDLRRTARFRYASVSLPEVYGPERKIFKSAKELNDALVAVVIRNLKTIPDRSKVIVMDADGSRSKGIARALKKLGVERPYMVQGGFQSWVKQGLRSKELKPETTLTILNEEAEAILEDISPTPFQVLGFGAGLVAASYALLDYISAGCFL